MLFESEKGAFIQDGIGPFEINYNAHMKVTGIGKEQCYISVVFSQEENGLWKLTG